MNELKRYDIWLVPNGRLDDFRRGITGEGFPAACKCWGFALNRDELRERFRDLAEKNYRREGGEFDTIVDDHSSAEGLEPDAEDVILDRAYRLAEDSLCKYLADLTADPDPLNWPRIEWRNDLKFVTIRESV